MKLPVYMDYQATTPVDPRVLESMLPYFVEKFGNPASRQHSFGWEAEAAVERARSVIAKTVHAEPREIIFTSGATESNNLAIKGSVEARRKKGNHVVTLSTEHKSVLDVCKKLERTGVEITCFPVDEFGCIDLSRMVEAITSRTILVSVMMANNEIGTIQDIAAIGKVCRDRDIVFHTDATQALGKIPIDVQLLQCDLLSFSGHKIYGPKGIGGLFVRGSHPKTHIIQQMDGGGHERNIRSGTLNVPGIVGLARAIEIAATEMENESSRLKKFRDTMWDAFHDQLDDVFLNGHPVNRLPNNLNVSFCQVEDNVLMMNLKDIAVSTGSACTTASPEPSHVLRALRIGTEREQSALRFSLGRFTSIEEVEYVIQRVIENVRSLRSMRPSNHRNVRETNNEKVGLL
jgi:cysteine desulfurase